MAKHLRRLNEEEMQALADKLAGMKFDKAKTHTRRLDPEAALELFRVGVGAEVRTRYRLPNLGVIVTLIETARSEPMRKDTDHLRAVPQFIEARVEALD